STAGLKRSSRQFWKGGVDEPVLAMFPFRPGIGEVDVQRANRVRRQEVFQEIRSLNAHKTKVEQAGPACFAVEFAEASEQAFDCDEVVVWAAGGPLGEERSVARAQFHFRRGRGREHIGEAKSLDPGLWSIDQGGGGRRGGRVRVRATEFGWR